jgi:hypothetical protein
MSAGKSMADTNNPRRDDFAGFSENDPFAELTRIMGHDPRDTGQQPRAAQDTQPVAAQEPEFGDDFDIDLENELLGELGLDDFAEPQSYQGEQPAQQAQPIEEPRAEEPWERYEAQAPAYQDEDYAGPAAEPEIVSAVHAVETNEPNFSDFEAEFEAISLEPLREEEQQADDYQTQSRDDEEPVPYPPVPQSVAPAAPAPVYEDDFDAALERELFGEVTASEDDAPEETVAFEASSYDDEPLVASEAPVAPNVSYAAASVPEWQDQREAEAVAAGEAEYEDDFYGDAVVGEAEEVSSAYDPAPNVEVTSAALTLEDELAALLSDEPVAATVARAEPVTPASTFTSTSTWPLASSMGRANFAPVQPASPPSYSAAPAISSGIESLQTEAVATATQEPEMAPEFDSVVSDARYETSVDDSDFDDLFADGFDLEAELGGTSDAGEEAASLETSMEFAPTPVSSPAVTGLDALAAWQPEHERVATPVIQTSHGFARAVREEAPDVETVELSEAAVAVTDDLDIPDVAYEAPTTPAQYSDLDSEIAEAFGDLSLDDAESAPVSQPATPGWSAASAAPVAAAGAAALGMGYAAQSAAARDDNSATAKSSTAGSPQTNQWEPQDLLPADQFDFDADLDQAIAMATYQDEEATTAGIRGTQSRERIIKLAAIAGGLVLLGGVGLFASSYFGGESSGPALVRADSEPMKVRPENPGGATVPNQDSPVYQSVAGTTPAAVPEQERLISAAEEPVDVTAQTGEEELLPPGFGADLEDDIGDTALPAAPKGEDRIEPEAVVTGPGAEGENPAVVAPRRVRTMVVRPDGTMVPREEIAPVVEAEPEQQQALVAPPIGQTPTLETAGTLLTPAADEGGPTVDTPATVSVVPTRRTEPSAAAPVVAQAPVPGATPAAPVAAPTATPVSAPAAAAQVSGATSEWSMQIASQPTAEGAQTAYQDLARRYGSVLQGRGVNIVRADIQGMGTYFRVRIPASSRDEAIQLCTRYKSAGGSCFVSR